MDDDFDEFLQKYNKNRMALIRKTESQNVAEQNLLNFKLTPLLDRKVDLLTFWSENKNTNPQLYKLAMIVLAIPMTQVSVERVFSAAEYVFSDLKGGMSSDLLQDILLIRCNGLHHV